MSVISTILMLGALALGTWVLARALLRAPAMTSVRCARCGTAGEALESFICPGCGSDVREVGLVATIRRSAFALFWTAMIFTLVMLLVSGIGEDVLRQFAPYSNYVRRERYLHPSFGGFESIEIEGSFTEFAGIQHGQFTADLTLRDGRMTIMQIVLPSRSCRMTDENGNVDGLGTFDQSTLRKWLKHSGVDDTEAEIRAGISSTYMELNNFISSDYHPLTGSLFSGGGGSSANRIVASWFRPALSAGGVSLWLLGLAWLLRERQTAAGGKP
jgi:hypothetical protein